MAASVKEKRGLNPNGSREHQCLAKQEGAKSEEKEQGRTAFLEFTPDLAVKLKSWLGHRSRSSDTNCNQSPRHPAMFWEFRETF